MKVLALFAICAMMTSFSGCTMLGGGGQTVAAKDNMFEPNTLSIKQNDEVTWNNEGSNRHTVTIHKVGDPVTTTKKDTEIAAGSGTSYKFEETGTFHVYCTLHSAGKTGSFSSGMVMTVTVAA